ncbi:MAG: TonB-dependent receptor plug domain-containing protein, partial [Bacteroidetes bacterium]|nr:TonB-dependent receptor plug domain-containing protein [Bacteroidota bacterium]
MKISSNCFGVSNFFHRKMIKNMKLTVFVFLAICLQVSARGYSQKITLNMQNVTIDKVFQEIKKQSGFLFLYNNDELKKIGNISVTVKDVDVLDALERSLSSTGLTFKIIDKTIVLNPKKTNSTLIKTDPIPVEIEVKGRVLNEKGDPLEGVTIGLKGGKQITATNANGEFKLNIEDPNATLVISAITIEPIDFKLNGRNNLTITVKTKTSILEDVSVSSVNTGYQTISRERSAGAFSKPNQTMIQDRSSSANLLQRLEGLVPGFAINLSQGSTPTGSNRMQTGEGNSNQYIIRGIGSVQSDRAPLYVVNGIVLDDLSSLNANDVEDVTVLKDATASSIWGSRAANGVVVIKTKKGRSNDKIKVQYDAFYNMLGKPDFLSFPRMTSAQFIKTAKEVFDPVTNLWSSVSAFTNATSGGGVPPHEVILYNQNRGLITASQANAQLDSLSKIYNGNQIGDYFYRNQALMNQTVSLSGGSKNYNFYGSFSYVNNQSYIPGEKSNQYTVNLRQDLNVSNRVKLFLITDLSNAISSTKRTILTDNRFLPYQLFKDNNGNSTDMSYLTYITTDSIKKVFERKSLINLNYNPIDEFNRGETNKNGVLARVTGGLSLKLLKGLKFEGTYGYALGNNKSTDYDAESSFLTRSTLVKFTQEAVLPSTIPTYFLPKTGGQLSTYNSMQKNWTVRNQLVFDTGFNGRKHQITILVGQEAKQSFSNNSNSVIRGYDPLLLTFQNIDYNTLALTGVTNPVVANNTGN